MNAANANEFPLYAQCILAALAVSGWAVTYLGCFAILLLTAGDLHLHHYTPRYILVPACLVLALAWPVWILVGMLIAAVILSSNAISNLHYAHKQQDTD